MSRDINGYSKADITIQPLRKYTGHASNVGVSREHSIRADDRMSTGTRLMRTCLAR